MFTIDIIKGILMFHTYEILHKINTHNIGLSHTLPLMKDDRTAFDIASKKVPYEKLDMTLYRWRRLIRALRGPDGDDE